VKRSALAVAGEGTLEWGRDPIFVRVDPDVIYAFASESQRRFTNSPGRIGIIAPVNSTETPGGSGIPAGWYDDPSGEGLRWWDGERWTEHVHSAESAAAATGVGADEGESEGKPPRDLVKLRESIRGRGVKAVGMFLGAILLVIVVIALLVSGGSDDNGGAEPGAGLPGSGQVSAAAARAQRQLTRISEQLQKQNLSQAEKRKLHRQLLRLRRTAGRAAQQQIRAAERAAREALNKAQE
jgi:hypothetical protein